MPVGAAHWFAASQGRPVTATRSLSRLVCQPASAAKHCTIWDPTAGLLFGAPSDAVPLSADVRPSQSPLLPGSREGWRRLSRPACRPALADACLNCAPPSYERAREDLRVLRWRQADQATSGMSHVASIALAPQTRALHATRSPNLCSGEQIPSASPRANSRAIVPTSPQDPVSMAIPETAWQAPMACSSSLAYRQQTTAPTVAFPCTSAHPILLPDPPPQSAVGLPYLFSSLPAP